MKRLLIAVLLILAVTTAFTQIVNKAEYFFDTDPGPGNGTSITISNPGVSVVFPVSIPVNISPGFHWLAIRVKDSDGKWSLFSKRSFFVSQPTTDLPIITGAEYFYDNDPGVGNGSSLTIQTPGFSVTPTFTIPVPANMTAGTHYLAIRMKDQAGHWSLFQRDTIVVGASAGTITCPGNVIVSAATGQCSAVVNSIDAVTSQAGASYTYTMNGATIGTGTGTVTGKTFNAGVTTVTYALNSTPSINCSFTVTVNASVTPTININASGTDICSGQQVTFTTTPFNGGATPSYQWKLNGNNIPGATGISLTTSSLANSDVVSVAMTSSLGCANPQTVQSNQISMNVSTSVVPLVSLGMSATTICAGTPVNFIATPTNGGNNPTYQWKLNGNIIPGASGSTYQSSTLVNGDIVSVVMTSSLSCANPQTATIGNIPVTVTPTLPPGVILESSSGTTICSGATATFEATPQYGGNNPSYQWKVNGNNVGTNSYAFSSSLLNNGDIVTVVMTSSLGCASPQSATSTPMTMTVLPSAAPSVNINASATAICPGSSVTFNVTSVTAGAGYQWQLNGNNIPGATGTTYQSSSLQNGDKIKVIMTASSPCYPSSSISSNEITISVNANVTPSVSIYASQTTICTGWLIKFYANPVNGGDAPVYQWKVNGNNAGTNTGIFQSTTLNDSDVVSVVMTSSLSCASQQPVESNSITVSVGVPVTPSVSIEADNTSICSGTMVTFTAHPTNGGDTPLYLWRVNGNDVGDISNTYQSSTLANGDSIQVIMTSQLYCAIISTAISNKIKMTVTQSITYYADKDGDGYGNAADSVVACGLRAGFVTNKSDCNDNNASVNPSATEICGNGIDDNCNGQIDENCTDSLPTLITKTYPVKEGDAGFTLVNVEVTLDKPAQKPISVNYATSNANATAGLDYVAANGILTIPVGATSSTIQLKVIGDLLREDNEIFWLTFSNPVNVLLGSDPRTRIMIIDDDKGKPNSASPNKDAITEVSPFKIPTVAKRNSVWMIPQISNYENEVMILNVQGQVVNRFINYKNQTPVGNVAGGLYFYRNQIKESSGQLKYSTGRLLITE
jgi:hypothetical protein